MSRRDSRSSIGARQNDALFEFENFKKKFLLANKHITKLNSTLSIRIEELNAQISLLYVENLRLRASEIALAAELKREREKAHQVLADAEAASQSLAKHLSYLRESHNIKPTPTVSLSPPSPRARRPVADPNASPTSPLFNRISRPPNVPGIYEEDEPYSSSNEHETQATLPRKKTKTKPRLSASKLPLPTRSSSPPRSATPVAASSSVPPPAKPRKTLRRPSGLLEINTEALSVPRSASPAFGSPIRLEAGRAEEAEEYAAMHGEIEVVIVDQADMESLSKKERKHGKAKEQRGSGSEDVAIAETKPRSREKKKRREEIDPMESVKPKSKDSTVQRTALQPIDSNVHDTIDHEATTASNRQFLRPSSPISSGPNSRGSSSPAPPGSSEDGVAAGSRERRTRKSVNYAEPKLNTKMRKPESVPGLSEPARKKRSSAAAATGSTSSKPHSSSSPTNGMDVVNGFDDIEPRSSRDTAPLPPLPTLPLRATNGGYIDPESFPLPASRPGSAAAMYSPGPPTRITGSTTSGSSTGSSSSNSNSSSSAAVEAMTWKKSRPQVISDDDEEEQDDESDGAEADAEYVGGGAGAKAKGGSWVNLDGRRKALPKRSAATAAVAAMEDIRRHSMAF